MESACPAISIDDNTNTKIIVDNIFSWSDLLEKALLYMECQLCVCQAYQVSLSLHKSCIFSKRFEFVGIDVCPDRNCPAMSKHQLFEHWLQPVFIQDIAKIVKFAQFYGKFITQFELRIAPLCDLITKLEYTKPVEPHWTTATQDSFNGVKLAILSDPCLKHFDHNRLIVLQSDFLSKGFSYVICQPETDTTSTIAIDAYCSGSDFSFMTKDSAAVLHPVAFGARC
jgi:hypothetical protein